jgi:hypothetical protein
MSKRVSNFPQQKRHHQHETALMRVAFMLVTSQFSAKVFKTHLDIH